MSNRNKRNVIFASKDMLDKLQEYRLKTGIPAKKLGDIVIKEFLEKQEKEANKWQSE